MVNLFLFYKQKEEITMDWPTAIVASVKALSWMGGAWAVAYLIVGCISAITRP